MKSKRALVVVLFFYAFIYAMLMYCTPEFTSVGTFKPRDDGITCLDCPNLSGDPEDETFSNGNRDSSVWPSGTKLDDRIIRQLSLNTDNNKIKVISVLDSFFELNNEGLFDECPVNNCRLIRGYNNKSLAADVVISDTEIKDFLRWSVNKNRNTNQITVWFNLESPVNSYSVIDQTINWTATYRRDSTLNAPYAKFRPFKNSSNLVRTRFNYAEGKTKMAAWFVSNCAANNGRREYAAELQKYISVDIYGACGTFECWRKDHDKICRTFLDNDYKFYLSFENSNCRDYITEKFFSNGLSNNVVPIVMGAHPEDYAQVAPPHSYIHVDDFDSPRELADYLILLDKNDTLYNAYFDWKGTGEFMDTKFWCRLCAMTHEAEISGVEMWYDSISKWWSSEGTCLLNRGKNETWTSWYNHKREANAFRRNSHTHIS